MRSRVLWSAIAALIAWPVLCPADDVSTRAINILQEALANKNPDVRKQAVVASSLATTGELYKARLIEMLQDKDVEVRVATIASLTEARGAAVNAALKKALQDEVPEVSFAAARALWAVGDPLGKRALMAVVEGESKTSSGFFTLHKREALRMLHTPRTALLFAARSGAGFAPIPGLGMGIASLQSLLTDPELSGRAAAAMLMSQRRDPEIIQALRDALKEHDTSLRAAAVHVLAMTNNASYRKDIIPLLDDDKDTVRFRAAAACIRLGSLRRKAAVQGQPGTTAASAHKQSAE